MKGRLISAFVLTVYLTAAAVNGKYYTKTEPSPPKKEMLTNLHFYFHDKRSGNNPTAVLIAKPYITDDGKLPLPFGTLFVIDNPLTIGPEITSEVIGNARGLYVSSGKDIYTLVTYFDFGFTNGKFNGSSISLFSRNPAKEVERELAVVGGRGKFRLARGFAQLKTFFLDRKNGDAIVEYNVTVFHY